MICKPNTLNLIKLRKYVRFLCLFLVCMLCISAYSKEDLNTITDLLDDLIDNKELFIRQKEARIDSLKALLNVPSLRLEQEYDINFKIYDEYKKFKLDSAIFYMEKNVRITHKLDDVRRTYLSNIKLAVLFSSSGRYRESEGILTSIDSRKLPKELLADYYEAYYMFYQHYESTSRQPKYRKQVEMYRDSILSALEPYTYGYRIQQVQKLINSQQILLAERILWELLGEEKKDTPIYAIITHHLGRINGLKGNPMQEKRYYTLSAIADVKNAIMENASCQRLALIYYQSGNIAKAFKYSQTAIDAAAFCNVQFRTVQMSDFYSIINAAYREQEAQSKKELFYYLILISILMVFLILLVLYVYTQMKKLSKVKEALLQTNNKFIDLNKELNEKNELLNLRNNQLLNANMIKEQYIAQFFSLCSTYINKIEDYRRSLYKIALNNQMDKLFKMLKSTTVIDDEFDELYQHFDSIFLSLYPTFIDDFNALLTKEEQILLKSGDLLNKELRIYALLRLGITDSARIATFLRCSLSTVYNYRTKIRNKAAISREEFENMLMNIGISPQNN